ncbi:hypothetical protein BOTBODRAFT_33558 [Botryobasidium botryosum FD-172 SS1]|uniref:Peroxisomal adenine nucleotide transporter 1 n=1 Tax=Botryobasidium botryosum (strain FD-172 SS1) TaxID=930990 RepID=A0A067MDA7_BOTB1|nr:hypothetical protein BOTBODRAFT_33558 [Botryobasidium botryosum FD-172 SS1]
MAAAQPEQLTAFGHALAGALGGVFSNAVVYPLDTAKTRIQATTKKGKGRETVSILAILRRILREEGVSGYYKGFGASMLNTFSNQYAYFFFYSFVRNSYIRRVSRGMKNPPPLSTAMELILGAVAGALSQVFTIPVSVIATRQQVGSSRKKSSPDDIDSHRTHDDHADNSFLSVAREIIKEDGVTGLWLGLRASLVLTVNPAITYGVFERVKSIVMLGTAPGTKIAPLQAFFMGALSKTMATVVTYPYIMAKVRIQARSDSGDEEILPHAQTAERGERKPARHDGAVDLLRKVYTREGLTGWYQGMSAQIMKAVLSQALLFMLKDQFERYALLLMILYRRLTSRR